MSRQKVVIGDLAGKYENPIAELVRAACQFTSTIILEDKTHRVNAKSIMGIMAFSPVQGKSICVEASGSDEEEAVQSMAKFLLCAE